MYERNPRKVGTPERWQAALQRALDEKVTVRQVNNSGAWVATSGTQKDTAYAMEVTGGIVHSCSCPAAEYGDDVCKHRAKWYHDAGVLDIIPEDAVRAAPETDPHVAEAVDVEVLVSDRRRSQLHQPVGDREAVSRPEVY